MLRARSTHLSRVQHLHPSPVKRCLDDHLPGNTLFRRFRRRLALASPLGRRFGRRRARGVVLWCRRRRDGQRLSQEKRDSIKLHPRANRN